MDWSILISAAALVLSGVAVWYSYRQFALNREERGNPSWSLRRADNQIVGMVTLTNCKSWPVYDIQIGADNQLRFEPSSIEMLRSYSAINVLIASESFTIPSIEKNIEVRWSRRKGGKKELWTYPLPGPVHVSPVAPVQPHIPDRDHG
jgi:hypothetical protein